MINETLRLHIQNDPTPPRSLTKARKSSYSCTGKQSVKQACECKQIFLPLEAAHAEHDLRGIHVIVPIALPVQPTIGPLRG